MVRKELSRADQLAVEAILMKILISGSCGFIGMHATIYYSRENQVLGLDNLSRMGSEENLGFLRKVCLFDFRKEDITTLDFFQLPQVDVIIHLAGQVGVQASINDPVNDFNQNLVSTLRVLEYARSHIKKPIVIYASTNKVYGDIQVNEPVSEKTPLDFHTPYGVSKGAADQYVLDYCRMYDIPTVVFRQSCIYGEYQLGQEEQGWIAWFMIANQTNQPLTIYGDGNQVRDVLHVVDLMKAYNLAIKNIDTVKGQAFNIGGGIHNTLSLNELVKKAKVTVPITFKNWRPADQKYYVSDTTKFESLTGWKPMINVDNGLERLQRYVEERWAK